MLKATKDRAEGRSAWRQLGVIRCGIKEKKRGAPDKRCEHPPEEMCRYCSYPKDLDYFVVPDELKKILGEKPKEIPIVLMHPGIENTFETIAVWFQGNNSRACYSKDGERAQRYSLVGNGPAREWKEIPCPGLECEYRQGRNPKCSERGYLSFGVIGSAEWGEYVLKHGSKVSHAQIYNSLRMVQELCQERKQGMFGIRMKLKRQKMEFFKDLENNGNQSKITKFIPILELDFNSLLPADKRLLGPIAGMVVPLLPGAIDADVKEIEE